MPESSFWLLQREQKVPDWLKTPVQARACYLEHVRIAVMGVLHHHHLDPGQSVRDAVLVFVAYGLKGERAEKMDQREEARGGKESPNRGGDSSIAHLAWNRHKNSTKNASILRYRHHLTLLAFRPQ